MTEEHLIDILTPIACCWLDMDELELRDTGSLDGLITGALVDAFTAGQQHPEALLPLLREALLALNSAPPLPLWRQLRQLRLAARISEALAASTVTKATLTKATLTKGGVA